MFRRAYPLPLRPGQLCYLVPFGDVHFDTDECDRERFAAFIAWCREQERRGAIVRLVGLGDYLDFLAPSGRQALRASQLYDTSLATIEERVWESLRAFAEAMAPVRGRVLGLLSGHHYYRFTQDRLSGRWVGQPSDAWLAQELRADYWGTGVALVRLTFPHHQSLDILCYHGSGNAQTPGGRVQKRIRVAEIAPTAQVVITGHDNTRLGYVRSGLDFDRGAITRYVIGAGSFQRAYLEGRLEAGYAERAGYVPADLGMSMIQISLRRSSSGWQLDYRAIV